MVDTPVLEQQGEQPVTFHVVDPRLRVEQAGDEGKLIAFYPTAEPAYAFYACHGCMQEAGHPLKQWAPERASDRTTDTARRWWSRPIALMLPDARWEEFIEAQHTRHYIWDMPVLGRGVVVLTDDLLHPTWELEFPLLPYD